MKMALLFAASLFSTFSATASNWIRIGQNAEVIVFTDTDSLRRVGPKVRSWQRYEWTKPMAVPALIAEDKKFRMERQLQLTNCDERSYVILQGLRYEDKDGTTLVHAFTDEEKDLKYEEPAPDTIGESLIRFACSVVPKRQ